MGWNLNDLASSAGAPAAASNPTGFVFRARGTQHVFFRGTDDRLHELTWDRRGWQRFDLLAGLKAPLAKGDPAAIIGLRLGTKHVVYAGVDGHVHELVNPGTGWRHTDVSAATENVPAIAGNPSACILEKQGTRHVFFNDAAGHVHELTSDGRTWSHVDLTATVKGAAPAAGNLAAEAQQANGTRFVVYRGKDDHVHELRCDESGWHATDLNASAKGAPKSAGDPAVYVFEGQGTRHVDYRCADGHIHQLYADASGWHHENLTQKTNAPVAASDPSGYMFNLQGTQHVLYRAADERLHELWWDVNGWHHDAPGAIGPAMTGRAAGYSFEMQKTQHAVYRQADGRIAELWWHPDGTGTGAAGESREANSLSMKWDPIVFDEGIPVSGAASLTVHADGRWEFSGHFHGSGFSAFEVITLWALRSAKGELFTFGAEGAVSGTLGTGARDFTWKLSGTEAEIEKSWSDIQAGWSWQAQSGTGLEWGGLWGNVRGAIGEIGSITAVSGPMFG